MLQVMNYLPKLTQKLSLQSYANDKCPAVKISKANGCMTSAPTPCACVHDAFYASLSACDARRTVDSRTKV